MDYKRGTSLYEYCVKENKVWILEQFDYEKNYPETPESFPKSSNKKIWFKYPCGHSCLQRISDKTNKNSKGCPKCLNRGGIGKSLQDEHPYFSEMFYAEKNGVTADKVTRMNGNEFWWKCPRCGNEFTGTVADVVMGHKVCGECSNKRRTLPEYFLSYYMRKIDAEQELDKRINGYRFDLFLPKYNLVIEYDGYPWHNTPQSYKNDVEKDILCRQLGIDIIRIRDSRLENNENLTSDVWSFNYDRKFDFLKEFPEFLRKYIGDDADRINIDISADFSQIQAFRFSTEKKNSLLMHIPELKKYLDNDKRNGNPQYVTTASRKIRFWLRDPEYPSIKWSVTAAQLFKKTNPYTQKALLCINILKRYPELEEQVILCQKTINCKTEFELKCSCGNMFTKSYDSLMGKRKVYMCGKCLKEYRLNNLRNNRKEKIKNSNIQQN